MTTEMNQSSSSSSRITMLQLASSTKTERKIIEKNRRNQMKTLFSNLYSLLPKQTSKEAVPLPDQIDEAISYIKSLEAKIKKSKEKKESLLASRKRSFSSCSTNSYESTSNLKPTQLEIREMGSSLEIVLNSGLDNQFIFYEIIGILHEEGVDILSASSSVAGSSILHVVHAQMRESVFGFGVAKVTERLNRFINGSASDIELEPELWDFNDLQLETWQF